MKRKDIIVMIATFIFIVVIVSLSYAFFAINTNLTNNIVQNMSFEGKYSVNVEVTNRTSTPFVITNTDMLWAGKDEVVANSTETFIINVTNNASVPIYCTYNLVWEWQSGAGLNDYTITTGATNEFTVSWLENETQVPNYNATSFVLGKYGTDVVSPNSTESFELPVETRFYNLADFDQTSHYNKSYLGYVKIANIACSGNSMTLAEYIKYSAPKSGTDIVSNSPWILISDHSGELRYAGKNPDNYISFNGELWRIIGVMPNMTYCTGTYGSDYECNSPATGDLVKIIRSDTLGNFSWDYKYNGFGSSIHLYGSNDWSDSQLMFMLNGTNYLKTGYDSNNTQLHTSYTVTSNVVKDGNGYTFYDATYSYLDGNGTTVYKPSTTQGYTATSATIAKKIESNALSQIATVKWDLYGLDAHDSPYEAYNQERNINGSGAVYTDASLPENRPVYWYGKIGLMYLSDYGYATNGNGTAVGTYSRNDCLKTDMYNWYDNGVETQYQEYCAKNDWLGYNNTTSTSPIQGQSLHQWTISPYNGYGWAIRDIMIAGRTTNSRANAEYSVRPVLYLKADTIIAGGNGTWTNPYTIEPKQYWHSNLYAAFPYYGGTLYSSVSETGYSDNIGQDGSKHYVCASDNNAHEICLSQPYTQYGLTDHTENTSFTSNQQTSAKQALYQAFTNAGFSINIDSNCGTSANTAYCRAGNTECTIDSTGYIYCGTCMLSNNDYATCSS